MVGVPVPRDSPVVRSEVDMRYWFYGYTAKNADRRICACGFVGSGRRIGNRSSSTRGSGEGSRCRSRGGEWRGGYRGLRAICGMRGQRIEGRERDRGGG